MDVEDSKSCCVCTSTIGVNSRYYGGGRRFLTSSYAVETKSALMVDRSPVARTHACDASTALASARSRVS